jgi:hypothetical protein
VTKKRISEWVDVKTLRALSQHASGAIGAVLLLLVPDVLLRLVLSPGPFREVLEFIEKCFLLGVFVILAWNTLVHLYNNREQIRGPRVFLLA